MTFDPRLCYQNNSLWCCCGYHLFEDVNILPSLPIAIIGLLTHLYLICYLFYFIIINCIYCNKNEQEGKINT
ncbi:MAG TPA: hypothetical protein VLG50_05485 [Candidatus Saccharimonadales bacterium]|nr:hypothetical protein [Candidatus Saccharimonadales bacterium]